MPAYVTNFKEPNVLKLLRPVLDWIVIKVPSIQKGQESVMNVGNLLQTSLKFLEMKNYLFELRIWHKSKGWLKPF
jgi:hypothetical protein